MNKEQNVRMTEKTGIQNLDIRIAIAVVICFLSATACSELGFKFTYGEMHLEILQKMTACIACLLCVQDNTKISRKAGVNRMIITAIGGIIGIGAAAADNAVGNPWLISYPATTKLQNHNPIFIYLDPLTLDTNPFPSTSIYPNHH